MAVGELSYQVRDNSRFRRRQLRKVRIASEEFAEIGSRIGLAGIFGQAYLNPTQGLQLK